MSIVQPSSRGVLYIITCAAPPAQRIHEFVSQAQEALVACYHINSRQNVTLITDIYQRVLRSSYGKSEDVRELGDMLTGWFG